MSAASRCGNIKSIVPMMSSRSGNGSSRITAIFASSWPPAPHTTVPIGPMRKRSAAGGNAIARSATMRGASATGFSANRRSSSRPSRRSPRSASRLAVRWIAMSPPTSTSRNPNGSGMGGMSAAMKATNEYAGTPPGNRVSSMPTARSAQSNAVSCSAPL